MKILVVEDDLTIQKQLETLLSGNGYEVSTVTDFSNVIVNRETIDLRYVEQLRDAEQSAALGYALLYAQRYFMDGKHTLRQMIEELEDLLEREGLDVLCPGRSGVPFLARPRRQELFACFNRCRQLRV